MHWYNTHRESKASLLQRKFWLILKDKRVKLNPLGKWVQDIVGKDRAYINIYWLI